VNAEEHQKDLIVIVADSEMEFVIQTLLGRYQALGIRQIKFEIKRHVQRDAGCRTDCHNYLREDIRQYRFSMVLFDREGCGKELQSSSDIEKDVENILAINGWKDRCAVVVIDPELEAWVWSTSPVVDEVFGWRDRNPPLREWVKSKTPYWSTSKIKPERPKEALRSAMKEVRQPFSSFLFADLAQSVSLERCVDPSFHKFKDVLRKWFSAG
jgi:hypothetical protein